MHVVPAVMDGKVPLEHAFALLELVALLEGLRAPETAFEP
jgi:hypothetical protein